MCVCECLHMYYLYVPMYICFLCICIAILCIRSVCRKQASHLCKRSQQPASLSLVSLCACVCTQSIIHAIIDTKQERRSQPASLGILINYNSSNNVAWNVVNTVQKVAKNLFALLRRRWQSTVILFVIRHLNTLLDLVIRLGVVAFALPSGSWF